MFPDDRVSADYNTGGRSNAADPGYNLENPTIHRTEMRKIAPAQPGLPDEIEKTVRCYHTLTDAVNQLIGGLAFVLQPDLEEKKSENDENTPALASPAEKKLWDLRNGMELYTNHVHDVIGRLRV